VCSPDGRQAGRAEPRDGSAFGCMDRRRKFDRQQALISAEVGEIPAVAHPLRRELCGESLLLFLVTYFPETTGSELFSLDHCRMIDRIENCLLQGGRFINCVYRGFAKTTITELAALWAALYGHRSFVAVFGADKTQSESMLDSVYKELCENDLLAEDFPEICLPFQQLDGKSQRCDSQTINGEHTHIKVNKGLLVFPTVRLANGHFSPGSGAILKAKGILGAARGMSYKTADGRKRRPDFALIDDFQTDESATHPGQVETRLTLIRKAILKSAGHRKTIACVINATMIAANDGVDQLLDRERNPSWDGERIPMVKKWAEAHDTLWQEYAKLRRAFNSDIPGDQQRAARTATAFYLENREAMDAGCLVSWHACYDPDVEESSIQHAYNLFFDDPPEVFDSECQCQPAAPSPEGVARLDAITIARKINGFGRTVVPPSATCLVAFIDVHEDVLYYAVCAWTERCTGFVVDYGTWPEQRRSYFMKRQATNTLAKKFKDLSVEDRIIQGLEILVTQLCGREWYRPDSTPVRIEKLLIDSGHKSPEVELVCRRSPFAAILQMSKGDGISAGKLPIAEYERRPGWKFGDNWYVPAPKNRSLRTVMIDTNYWKTWLRTRLATPIGTEANLSLFGQAGETDHRLLGDHLVSESPTETQGRGRTVIEWLPLPGYDNHWLDCLVGCSVGASMQGCSLRPKSHEKKLSRRERALIAARKRGLAT